MRLLILTPKSLFICSLLILAFSSCTTVQYGVPDIEGPVGFKPLATYRSDSLTKATFISGSLQFNRANQAYDSNEKMRFGRLSITRAMTEKGLGLSYGIQAYRGNYRVNPLRANPGSYSFYGAGASFSLDLRVVGSSFSRGRITPKIGLNYEGGDFREFRRITQNQEGIENLHRRALTLHYGLGFLLDIDTGPVTLGLQYYAGVVRNSSNSAVFSLSGFLNYKNYTLFSSGGLIDEGTNREYYETISFGIAYRLPNISKNK